MSAERRGVDRHDLTAQDASARVTERPRLDDASLTEGARSTAGYRFWVVPHTHWDREWYLPFEEFRIRLARTVDEIIDVLEADPRFHAFTLDGQAVILEDYLEVRPQAEARLRALVETGRIAIGPAYILPDEYLVSAEALVRNFLAGRRVCERYGGRPMDVGYMPDTFGHVAQLPQILRGFGLDTFVFWRGLGDEAAELGAVFNWQAPDGSRVLAIRQLGSYGNSDEFGRWGRNGASFHDQPERWGEIAGLRFQRFLELFGDDVRRSEIHDLLLCNGSDHKPVMPDLPVLVDAALEENPASTARIATYEEYVRGLRASLGPREATLPDHEGELCGGRDAHVLRGVNSARMYLKQADEATERSIFVAEVLASLADLRAHADLPTSSLDRGRIGPPKPYRYPLDELRLAWRELLRNQPHDSISGCSVDEVHRDMAQRHVSARQIAGRIRREALAALAGHSAPWTYREEATAQRSVVNVLPWPVTGAVELELPAELSRARSLVAEIGGECVPAQASGGRALVAATVPGFGACAVRLSPGTVLHAPGGASAVDDRTIENRFYRVTANDDGTLAVTELSTGRVFPGLLRFEDSGDRGDEYTYCPVAGDPGWRSDDHGQAPAAIRVRSAGPVAAELEVDVVAPLPATLDGDRIARSRRTVDCRIRTLVRLTAGVERIDFTTTVRNRAKDHRLRVVFEAPDSRTDVRVEGHFGVLRRPAVPIWSGEGWVEPPALTHHTGGMVAAGRLAVFGKGLPEYQAVLRPGGGLDVALTLLRCVGWLSQDDLETRPGEAGPKLETPDAQCLGSWTFEYAISLRGEDADATLVRAAQAYRVGLVDGPEGVALDGLLSLDGEAFAFSALKGAEDGDGLILRVFNPSTEMPASVEVAGRSIAGVEPVRMDEVALEDGAGLEDALPHPRLDLPPARVATARLRA